MIIRNSLIGDVLYQLTVVTADPEKDSKHINRFFESIDIHETAQRFSAPAALDRTNPTNVLNAVFAAAKSGSCRILNTLFDPIGENDGDTRDICLTTESVAAQKDFVKHFAAGRIIGEPRIKNDRAQIPFVFGSEALRQETMELVRRGQAWYLFQF